MMDDHAYTGNHYEHGTALSADIDGVRQYVDLTVLLHLHNTRIKVNSSVDLDAIHEQSPSTEQLPVCFVPPQNHATNPVPVWAVWLFAACFLLIILVLLLDYCVIRRNALGNKCCTRARQKRNTSNAIHQKRSTNMLLNVWKKKLNRQAQCADQDV